MGSYPRCAPRSGRCEGRQGAVCAHVCLSNVGGAPLVKLTGASGRILRSCWHRFQSVYVFWQGCMFSRQQKFRFESRSSIPACC
eukprot:COSAG01_NODE_3643_length_5811_cov_7.353967_7_plen_84_part_00